MLAGLDHLAQPHALDVAADVLDLVGDGAAVRRPQGRQRLGERGAGDVDAQHLGGDPRHDLRRESQGTRVQGRIAGRLRAQWVEPRGQVAEVAVGADEGHGGGDVFQVLHRHRSP